MRYELRLAGHLDVGWSAWLEGWTVTQEPDGTTCLRGEVDDQAALHGVLARIRDLGATLLSVEATSSTSPPRSDQSSAAAALGEVGDDQDHGQAGEDQGVEHEGLLWADGCGRVEPPRR